MSRFRTRGHRHAAAFVQRVIETESPPHALLLFGPAGIGKTTLARDLAAGLLCLDGDPTSRPCGRCAACRKVDHGNHPDLHQLEPDGVGQQIRVAQVQALAVELSLLPLEGRFRVAIIKRAQRLNPDAQNALLKTLEEPPAAVCLILAADDSSVLLPTVVSRCACLRLNPVAAETIGELIAEFGLADRARGAALARLSGGRPGAALALARRPEAVLAQERISRTLLDLLAGDRRRRLAVQPELLEEGAVLATTPAGGDDGNGSVAVDEGASRPVRQRPAGSAASERVARRPSPAERRAAVAEIVRVWRDVARDLAVAARGGRREVNRIDLLEDLSRAADTVDGDAVTRFVMRLDAAARALDAYANPELCLDALLLEWPRSRAAA